jgi:hypothetical protein
MHKLVKRSLVLALAVMFILNFTSIFPVHATNGAEVFVDPASIVVDTSTHPVGTQFTVDVVMANLTGLGGYEFKMQWDSTILTGVSMTEVLFTANTPSGQESNIWALKNQVDPGGVWYSYTYMDMATAISMGYAPIDINTTTYPPDGEAIVATITLEVAREPTKSEGSISTALDIYVSKAGDTALPPGSISHTTTDGFFQLEYALPTFLPYLSTDPDPYKATEVGETFDIDVLINDLASGWEMVGLEFKLGFNGTLINATAITNGTFFEGFAGSPNGGVLYFKTINTDFVHVGIIVLPDENGTWHSPFPSGSGVVATISFEALYQGLFPEVASCVLDLFAIKGGDTEATPIDFDPEDDGWYEMAPKVLGRAIDVYTQYPFPYGGQGINQTSDLFWPQKLIHLFANVTYNEWPEQRKDVTFEVRLPNGEILFVLGDTTDEWGVAHVAFRIPWPECEMWLCHEFTVVASVDIACNVTRDWLWFHFDYLVRWIEVTTDKTEYKHCEYVNVTVDFKSKAMQTYPVVLSVALIDELDYPWGFLYFTTEVGGAEYCHYKNYTHSFPGIHVHKHVHAGIATVHVNALSGLPWISGEVQYETYGFTWGYTLGSAWVPEYAPPPEITILAEWAPGFP